MKKNILDQLFNVTGCINFSPRTQLEAQKGFKSPIFLDFKKIINYPKIRKLLAYEISNLVNDNSEMVCGFESGGNYLSGYVADRLNMKLSFFRRTPKEYGKEKEFVGLLPNRGSNVTLIDDVIATGKSLSRAKDYFYKNGAELRAVYIFSYGFDQKISTNLNINIKKLFDLNNLLKESLKRKLIDKNMEKKIRLHVAKFPLSSQS